MQEGDTLDIDILFGFGDGHGKLLPGDLGSPGQYRIGFLCEKPNCEEILHTGIGLVIFFATVLAVAKLAEFLARDPRFLATVLRTPKISEEEAVMVG